MKSFQFSILAMILLVGAALFVLFERNPLEAQGQRALVWEYQIIRMGASTADQQDARLQEAGGQGWECVSLAFTTNGGATNGVYFVLKRQKVAL
ncbi:MAG TPA: hypothetical protein VGP76_00845 [Planctomycetaceae bacterium]|jgi:hypothetical protein|nr:hypothetical protein [Planctomycetaceae bacterium]